MFLTFGNIPARSDAGVQFFDFENPIRMHLNEIVTAHSNDPFLGEFVEAQHTIRVKDRDIFVNCLRYIHLYKRLEESENVPKEGSVTPVAE